MRRKERQVTDPSVVLQILEESQVCHLGIMDENFPYVLPLNFGYTLEKEKLTLYFHCAPEGKKLDLIQKNPQVSFSIATSYELITGPDACDYTMTYGSVLGKGRIEILEEEKEKLSKLQIIMKKYGGEGKPFQDKYIKVVKILCLHVEEFTAKQHIKG